MNQDRHEGYQSPCWTCVRLDNDVLRRLQRDGDDDDITDRIDGLEVCENQWIQGAGYAIGNSKHLKSLHVLFGKWKGTDWAQELCQGLAFNKTIEKLSLEDVDCFDILFPFFANNGNLRCLELIVSSWELNPLFQMLSKCKMGLEFIKIDFRYMSHSDAKLAMFFNSLEMHSSLLELCINYTSWGLQRMGCKALANLLVNPACKIRLLQLNTECESTNVIRRAMIQNCSVTSLHSTDFLTVPNLCAICAHPMCSLVNLWINNYSMTKEDLTSFGKALALNKSVKHLYLYIAEDYFFYCEHVGWRRFSTCLATNTVLETLEFKNADEEKAMAIIQALALANNNSIRKFIIGDEPNSRVREAIAHLLCDQSSIDSIFSSCHTLHTITYRQCNFQDDCEYYLQMNKNDDKLEVARQKIMEQHFSEAKMDANVQMFACLPASVLPTVVEWIGRDRFGFSLMFLFVQRIPELFEHGASVGTGGKRRKLLS